MDVQKQPAPRGADYNPKPDPGDYVALDDDGNFTHHHSAASVAAAFESMAEVLCVVDRNGNNHSLVPDGRGLLMLSLPHGTVDCAWLAQEWATAQHKFPDHYRVRRFHPGTLTALLADLFETLELDQHLELLGGVAGSLVRDVFGHSYKVISHGRQHLRSQRELYYVEVAPGKRGEA